MTERSRIHHGAVALVAAAALVTGLGACAEPSYQFVSSDDNDVVLRVPASWAELDKKKVDTSTPQEGTDPGWVVYFDAASRPDPAHARSDSVSAPILTARSITLTEQQAAELTEDQMRDFLTPVTKAAVDQFKLTQMSAGAPEPKITTMKNEKITTKNSRGVHIRVGYDLGTGQEIFDKVVLTNKDKTRLHLLLMHCSTSCFQSRGAEIAAVADSFTVKTT